MQLECRSLIARQRKSRLDEFFRSVEANVKPQLATEILHCSVRRRYPALNRVQPFFASYLNEAPQQLCTKAASLKIIGNDQCELARLVSMSRIRRPTPTISPRRSPFSRRSATNAISRS